MGLALRVALHAVSLSRKVKDCFPFTCCCDKVSTPGRGTSQGYLAHRKTPTPDHHGTLGIGLLKGAASRGYFTCCFPGSGEHGDPRRALRGGTSKSFF